MADQVSPNLVQKPDVSSPCFILLLRFACLAALCSFATLASAQNTTDGPSVDTNNVSEDPEAVWTTVSDFPRPLTTMFMNDRWASFRFLLALQETWSGFRATRPFNAPD